MQTTYDKICQFQGCSTRKIFVKNEKPIVSTDAEFQENSLGSVKLCNKSFAVLCIILLENSLKAWNKISLVVRTGFD